MQIFSPFFPVLWQIWRSVWLSSARMLIECTFRKLKARFGYPRRNIKFEELPGVIHSFFILHNFSKSKNELVKRQLFEGIFRTLSNNLLYLTIFKKIIDIWQGPKCNFAIAWKYDKNFQTPSDKNDVVNNNESIGRKITYIDKFFS